jgi:hypothetical protein
MQGSMKKLITVLLFVLVTHPALTREFHVSVKGVDGNDGSPTKPLRTISAAARVAQPGDIITVHEGTYRERVTPPRGGESDTKRIVYQTAAGEKAVIKGSEVIRGWKPFKPGVWKVTIPNSFFGNYNPYKDVIWGDWFRDKGRPHHTGEVYLNGKSLWETHLLERVLEPRPAADIRDTEGSTWTWFCESDGKFTYIYANFHDKDPNQELIEINVRDSCFYPDQPGRNYITIRGFHMSQAATQWAAPTAEQIGLIGTHWSKGWIIESNVISDSKCSGISLGKDRATGHNDWVRNPAIGGATHYHQVITRALEAGWSREKIGSHIVRNNTISNCEQTGIVGSLGAVFSEITNNHIYSIWTKRQFTGSEMASIKLHAAIDVLIKGNRIHNGHLGLWMDWMAQGTRITGNLLYDNSYCDLLVEVDLGPFIVDNNLFLSGMSLYDESQGGAYVHNLMTGKILSQLAPDRSTPYHDAHSTRVAGQGKTEGGDNRFYNNMFVGSADAAGAATRDPKTLIIKGFGLWVYGTAKYPLQTGGNVYFHGARPYTNENDALVLSGIDPKIQVVEAADGVHIRMTLPDSVRRAAAKRVTTALLGKAKVAGLAYENSDGSPVVIDYDYFGKKRTEASPSPGPFENAGTGEISLKAW